MHHPLKWGIDLDGCLVNFNEGFAQRLRTKGALVPSFVTKWPDTWHWPHEYATSEQVQQAWNEVWASPTFWRDLEPLPEVDLAEMGQRLRTLVADGHELYFLTHRQGVRVHAQSVEWLKLHLGLKNPQVIIVPGSKAKVALELELDVVLDDMPQAMDAYSDATWRDATLRPFMLVRPYNANLAYSGLRNVVTVKTVADVLNVVLAVESQEAMVVS